MHISLDLCHLRTLFVFTARRDKQIRIHPPLLLITCSLVNFVGARRHLKCLESKIHVTANSYSSFVFWYTLFCHFPQVRKNDGAFHWSELAGQTGILKPEFRCQSDLSCQISQYINIIHLVVDLWENLVEMAHFTFRTYRL